MSELSSEEDIYFDAPEGVANDKLSHQTNPIIANSLTIENGEKRNRIESLKKSSETRKFSLNCDLPNYPVFDSINETPKLKYVLDIFGEEHRILTPCVEPFSARSPRLLSRTLPEKSSFISKEGTTSRRFAEHSFASPSLCRPDFGGDYFLPRSKTAQPSGTSYSPDPDALHLPLSSLTRDPQQQQIITRFVPETTTSSQERASAPEVSRRNHVNVQDYVKSWSLDTARYQHLFSHRFSQKPTHNTLMHDNAVGNENQASNILQSPTRIKNLQETSDIDQLGVGGYLPQINAGLQTQLEAQGPLLVGRNEADCLRGFNYDSSVFNQPTPPPRNLNDQLASATLPASFNRTSGQHSSTINPMSLDYRTRTLSTSSLQCSVASEKNELERSDTLRSPNLISGIRRLQTAFRGAMNAVRTATKVKNEQSSDEDAEIIGNQGIRLRCSRKIKAHRDFLQIKLVQKMETEHTGAIWAMRASPCGRLLATAGYDRHIRIWVLRQWYTHFKEMQQVSSNQNGDMAMSQSVRVFGGVCDPSIDDLDSISLTSTSLSTNQTDDGASSCSSGMCITGKTKSQCDMSNPSMPSGVQVKDDQAIPEHQSRTCYRSTPLLVYRGHEGVVTELSWSKNLFLLSTGMDRQVRLWHISRAECLCAFSHNDTVPAIVFHPKDDRYFLSGSLDGKLRLWNIPDKKVRFWVNVPLPSSLPASSAKLSASTSVSGVFEPKTIITCATFACDATKVVVGSYDGRVMFFNTELTYITFITIKSMSGGGHQCRVTAIEADPTDSNKLLVTSNDSRVRLIDARDYHTLCKYRGFVNETSQIRASFSPTGRYIISGSENCFFYIWRKQMDFLNVSRFSSSRKDRNNCWESIKAHDAVVTVAIFLPSPEFLLDKVLRRFNSGRRRAGMDARRHGTCSKHSSCSTTYWGEVVVSADCNGCIRVFKNRIHPQSVISTAGNVV